MHRRLLLLGLVGLACDRTLEMGSDWTATNNSAQGGNAGLQDAGADAESTECEVTRCDGKIYACGDCLDNDSDGVLDRADPECMSVCDDTEDLFFSGILGQRDGACKLDCYFDGDNGSGNDDCHWSTRCDELSQSPDFSPSGDPQCAYDPLESVSSTALTCEALATAQSARCLETCLPQTPEGCDCFGCCEIPKGSGRTIWLGSVSDLGYCNMQTLNDPTRCRPCTRNRSCFK
ncbi:MAG TPA: hypothetical protein VKP30_03480 [Polyangiaceae bacterium]|nr:hypothetical protein [Polyangiaceae bacterium]